MSVAVKRGISAKGESRKCAARFWRLFPHLLLCLSLVAYAALGALLFQHIEGESASTTQQDYREFLGQIVRNVQNLTANASITHQDIVNKVEFEMQKGFKSIWFQRPERWTFFGSMFFCCTVFTTVVLTPPALDYSKNGQRGGAWVEMRAE
ncbi:potassium channel subfamily K member 18-like [Morone saxatilis]|uniref:potassium channel subfamily K member 18-like n=1 Tax=Morone saxatilis TaxID=34816 RepID=UPI0015E21251|nr:potassium channel subfamily K member 18-like [Morone saxatilis]